MLKWIRNIAWVMVAVIAAAMAWVVIGGGPGGLPGGRAPLSAAVGGPFELLSHDGKRISDQTLKGKPFAIFFGFTYCPDVCPTSLLDMSNQIKELGADAQKMRFLFVSVDHERDTTDQLKLYLSSFDPAIIGLTGTAAEIADITRKYRVLYEKVPTKDGYTINHTATVYLMDADGKFSGTLAYQEDAKTAVEKLRRLVRAAK